MQFYKDTQIVGAKSVGEILGCQDECHFQLLHTEK